MAGFSFLDAPDVTQGSDTLLAGLGALQQSRQVKESQEIEKQLSAQRQSNVVIERLRRDIQDSIKRGDVRAAEDLSDRLADAEGRPRAIAPAPPTGAGRPAEGGVGGTEPVAPPTTEVISDGQVATKPTSQVSDQEFEATLRAGGTIGGINLGGASFEEFQESMRQAASAAASASRQAGGGGVEEELPQTPAGRQIVDNVQATGEIAPTDIAANALRSTQETADALNIPAPRTAAGRAAQQRAEQVTQDEQLAALGAFLEPALKSGDAELTGFALEQLAALLPEEARSEFEKIKSGVLSSLRSKAEQRQTEASLTLRNLRARVKTSEAAAKIAEEKANENDVAKEQTRLDKEASDARAEADAAADAAKSEAAAAEQTKLAQASEAEENTFLENKMAEDSAIITRLTPVDPEDFSLQRKQEQLLRDIKRAGDGTLHIKKDGTTVDKQGRVWRNAQGVERDPEGFVAGVERFFAPSGAQAAPSGLVGGTGQ